MAAQTSQSAHEGVGGTLMSTAVWGLPPAYPERVAAWADQLEVGHFTPLDAPDEVALHLAEWQDDIHAREAGASLDI